VPAASDWDVIPSMGQNSLRLIALPHRHALACDACAIERTRFPIDGTKISCGCTILSPVLNDDALARSVLLDFVSPRPFHSLIHPLFAIGRTNLFRTSTH
jgi:hypothetical protein